LLALLELVLGGLLGLDELVASAFESRFWDAWITNTIRNVMIVVPVLMMSCQVSEKLMIGPVTAQPRMSATAATSAKGDPSAPVRRVAIRLKRSRSDVEGCCDTTHSVTGDTQSAMPSRPSCCRVARCALHDDDGPT
jgi:hypothetical protein